MNKGKKTMNNLVLSLLISLTSFTVPYGSSYTTVSQDIVLDKNTTSLVTHLDGAVEFEYWDDNKVVVETIIASNLNNEYALNYSVRKQHFILNPIFSEQKEIVTLMPKRINTTLLISGQKQKTKHVYKIFLPKHIDYSCNWL